MEYRDRPMLEGDDKKDSLEGNGKKAQAQGTFDLSESKVKSDDFAEEFPPELPNMSPAASTPPPYTSLRSTLTRNHEKKDFAHGVGEKRLDHAPPVEPSRPPSRLMVDSVENRAVLVLTNHEVRPGAFAVEPSLNGATAPTCHISSHESYGAFSAEEFKEEEVVPNSAGADNSAHNNTRMNDDVYAVEAHRVQDEEEETNVMIADAQYIRIKWYQRPLYRWILFGSVLFSSFLLGTVVVLVVVRPASAGNPSSPAPTAAPIRSVPTPEPIPSSLTPEQTACDFLSLASLTACRATSNFDTLNDAGDSTTGSTIPNEVGILTQLSWLDVSTNQLKGTIPSEIGVLSKMEWLNFYTNQLTGSIPSEIGHLPRLEYLDFGNNQLTGSIPSEIGQLSELLWLKFETNRLTGSIPSEIGLLSHLTYLDFGNNQLTGSIPSEIGLLVELTSLYFYTNRMTGSIPSEIGLLVALTSLNFYTNTLIGSIPSSFCPNVSIAIDCGKITCDSGCCTDGDTNSCGV